MKAYPEDCIASVTRFLRGRPRTHRECASCDALAQEWVTSGGGFAERQEAGRKKLGYPQHHANSPKTDTN